jgi:transcriptional regulator with XRE-family HTH domain
MGGASLEIGKGLRRVRRARGLTLRDVSRLSEGKYKPTSVAGYERGERTISLERFCDLCRLYDVPAPALLAEILESMEARPEVELDLRALRSLGSSDAAVVSRYVREIRTLRRAEPSETISLRWGDVEVLADATSREPEELIDLLGSSADTRAGTGEADMPSDP